MVIFENKKCSGLKKNDEKYSVFVFFVRVSTLGIFVRKICLRELENFKKLEYILYLGF